MGVWDATTPVGTEAISQGDDRIRELKTAIAEALSHEDSTFPGATPASTPIFIPGFLKGATGSRPTGDSLVSGRFYCNETLNIIERYTGAAWASVATNIPSGTKMVFYQASAPTGWTAVALNDKFLRVVSAGGTGGSSGGSGLTPSSTITLAHTHTVASHTHDLGNHTHTIAHTHSVPFNGWTHADFLSAVNGGELVTTDDDDDAEVVDDDIDMATANNTTGASSAANSGTPSSNDSGAASPATDSQLTSTAFQYADVIVATKD